MRQKLLGGTRTCGNPRCAEILKQWDRAGRIGLCPSCRLAGAAGPVLMLVAMALWKLLGG